MSRTKSSRQWLDRQRKDVYVKQAKAEGFRSRAAYKLLELQAKDKLLERGMRVLDLGAAPGGWSQVAARIVGGEGRVLAVDILPIEAISGVSVIQADFREDRAWEQIEQSLAGERVDVLLSDMAPNMSGNPAVDQPRIMLLCEMALDLAPRILKPGGSLVVKTFHGRGFEDLLRQTRSSFRRVSNRKPKSSRTASREYYLVATGFSL